MIDQEAEAVAPSHSAIVFWRWWNRVLLVLVLAALVWTRLLAHAEGGALWRDEAHSVDVATHSDFGHNCFKDSFPVLWALVLRGWVGLFGSEDASVRALGLIIGLAVIPAMFWMGRQFGVAIPYWMLLFLGLDPNLIVYGGEVRGYGLGIVSLLVMAGAAWSTLQSQTPWRWAGLCAAALLAVQTSYTNCFILLATISGCCVVALRRRQYRAVLGFVAVGVVAALSMLPYALFVFPRVVEGVDPFRKTYWGDLAGVCYDTVAWGGGLRLLAWMAVGSVAAVEIARQLSWSKLTDDQARPGSEVERALFLATFVVVGSAGFWWYMKWLRVMTQPWYYLPWLAVLAMTSELGSKSWAQRTPVRHRHKLLAVTVCLLMLFTVIPAVRFRMTNIDLVANRLSNEARPGDLIIVCPWYMGSSFERYYQGSAQWTNFPDVHHFLGAGDVELMQNVMSKGTPAGIRKDLDRMHTVLESGGRIWWVGLFRSVPPKQSPTVLEPAPDSRYGWDQAAYLSSCLEFAGQELRSPANSVRRIQMNASAQVNPLESPSILVFQRLRRPSENRLPSSLKSLQSGRPSS
jgi:hypothetical protein